MNTRLYRTIQYSEEDENKTNLADVLTKPLPQITREYLCDKFMNWWLLDHSGSKIEAKVHRDDITYDTGYLLGTQWRVAPNPVDV